MTLWSWLLVPFLLSAVICAGILAMLLRSRWSARLLDQPLRPQTMHITPVPRMGGLGIVAAVAMTFPGLSVLWLQDGKSLAPISIMLLAAAALAGVSFLDDRRGLPVLLRFAAHLLAAGLAVIGILVYGPDGVNVGDLLAQKLGWILFLTVGIAWMTNIFNFMDGSDGMAGGMALIGFGAYALAACGGESSDSAGMSILAASISGGALGFLRFNFPPARIFMGDAGSVPLGFLAAALGLQGVVSGIWGWWFPLLVFSPFIVDASSTLLFRLMRRERIWEAHRSHYYQRLILAGWGHAKTAYCGYTLMLAAAAGGLFARRDGAPWGVILGAWVVIYALLLLVMEWRLRPDNKDKTK